MTASRRDGMESPFACWVRNHQDLDSVRQRLFIADADYIVHNYRSHHDQQGERMIDSIMLIELKTFCTQLPRMQRDTLVILSQVLAAMTAANNGRGKLVEVNDPQNWKRGTRLVRFWGVYLLTLSQATPIESDRMWWNKTLVTVDQLVGLLRFDLSPDSLGPNPYRRHHSLIADDANNMQLPLAHEPSR